ncbi:MAG: hypothetical protein JXJ04_25845 [Spirochaetales bacterium]|nr:hypothetical protein [Spirochaetales bacterium]
MRTIVILLCLFQLFIFPYYLCWAEEEQAADAEPADPDIVLPSVILEIEDLSIETIEAVLPGEAELLPPERKVPLPEEDIMEVKDPVPGVAYPDQDISKPPGDSSFIAEAILGAGSVNNILSQISFYKLGKSPRYKLLFSHEMLDGFAFHDAGTGYNLREDSLEASLQGEHGILETEISGNYFEKENGLQGQGNYFSNISRFIDGTALFSVKPVDVFTLSAGIGGSFTSMSLTGASVPEIDASYPPLEIVAKATLGGEYNKDSITLGIESEYTYRNLPGDAAYDLHRILARAYFGFELPLTFIVNGEVGYFYASQDLWFVPFTLNLTANPADAFSFRLSGGYKRETYDLFTVWREFEYVGFVDNFTGDFRGYPDNHGWFGDGSVKFNIDNNFILSLGCGISANSLLLGYGDDLTPELSTGLFTLVEEENVLKATGELGLGIHLTGWLDLNLTTKGNVLFMEDPEAWLEAGCEGISAREDGKFGGSFSLIFTTDFEKEVELPLLDVALFFKISDNIRIIGEGSDLLSPLIEDGRIIRGPFVSPGIRGTIKVHITF